MRTMIFVAWLAFAGCAIAQTGPTASVTSVDFTYTANTPSSLKLKTGSKNPFTATLPTSMSSQSMVVSVTSNPQGWLSVTPTSGSTPLVLTVTVNPTTLDPGNHSGIITIDTKAGSGNPALVTVTIAISNAPSSLKVTSPQNTAVGSVALGFSYVTGDATPDPFELDISSSGDVIPFTVAATSSLGGTAKGTGWLRLLQSNLLVTGTSGVALSGSVAQLSVAIDPTALKTLDPKLSPFTGTITVTPSGAGSTGTSGTGATAGTPITVTVTLQVLAGAPKFRTTDIAVFPPSVPAAPANDPVITLYGDNFFESTAVTISKAGSIPSTPPKSFKCIDRTVIQITIDAALFTGAGDWTITVYNAGQLSDSKTLTVTDPTQPIITSVVSAASFLPTSIYVGDPTTNPVASGATSVAPREIISIFGRNIGPSTITPVPPTGTPASYQSSYNGVKVQFLVSSGGTVSPYDAPLIMISSSQINCVVPVFTGPGTVTVSVSYNAVFTPAFPVTLVTQDPAIFTIGGVGQGQAAVLNFNSVTGSFTVNSSSAKAGKNTAISIFATGLGDLALPSGTGAVALGAGEVAPNGPVNLLTPLTTVHVDIGGQPAVVTYAGTSPGAVAGLVQINAFVPLSAASGVQTITVGVTRASMTRRSPPGVTINVQ